MLLIATRREPPSCLSSGLLLGVFHVLLPFGREADGGVGGDAAEVAGLHRHRDHAFVGDQDIETKLGAVSGGEPDAGSDASVGDSEAGLFEVGAEEGANREGDSGNKSGFDLQRVQVFDVDEGFAGPRVIEICTTPRGEGDAVRRPPAM